MQQILKKNIQEIVELKNRVTAIKKETTQQHVGWIEEGVTESGDRVEIIQSKQKEKENRKRWTELQAPLGL